ncbi:magnesium-transporting ATPase, P-type 1 [Ditylenchus destructor]|uniref:Magnesium-transporting ATPase, P-type 1 n=1 Tax=Ditylenchus destructor TaxID=166010 RepID=A0AAD4MHK3_9BILA|nr:magnesium-transporting ATPase, P-type 1 [Ditylenchus destructor]
MTRPAAAPCRGVRPALIDPGGFPSAGGSGGRPEGEHHEERPQVLFRKLPAQPPHLHHFERWQTLLGSKPVGTGSVSMPPDIAKALNAASRTDAGEMLVKLGSSPRGLSEGHAQVLPQSASAATGAPRAAASLWQHLWQCYRNPFNLLLTVLALVSYAPEDMKATLVIGSMVVPVDGAALPAGVALQKAADRLKAMVSNTSTVLPPPRATRRARRATKASTPRTPAR